MVQIVAQKMLEEASDGGPTTVAGCGRVGSVGLKMIEKSCNQVGIEIVERQRGDHATVTLRGKLEQELERIAIRARRMRARAALAWQISGEE
jgi:hypothetical protein